MSATAFVVLVCLLAVAVLVGGACYVRFELRSRVEPPPSWAIWLGYGCVAAVVIFGAARVSYATFDLQLLPASTHAVAGR